MGIRITRQISRDQAEALYVQRKLDALIAPYLEKWKIKAKQYDDERLGNKLDEVEPHPDEYNYLVVDSDCPDITDIGYLLRDT